MIAQHTIQPGDLVRPKYARPTGLFEVIKIADGNKVEVIVHRQWHEASYRKGGTFMLSAELLQVVKKGDTKVPALAE